MQKKNVEYLEAKLENLAEDIKELRETVKILRDDLLARRAYARIGHWVLAAIGAICGTAIHILTRIWWR